MINPIIISTIKSTDVFEEYEYPFSGWFNSDEDDYRAKGFKEGFDKAKELLKKEILKNLKELERKGIV